VRLGNVVFEPVAPQTLDDLGLTSSLINDLLLKRLFLGGPQTSGSLSEKLAIPFAVVLQNLNEMRRVHLTHVSGSEGYGERSYTFILTEEGEDRARAAFERNMYDGPAPVPLEKYIESVQAQTVRDVVVTRRDIEAAFDDLVLHPEILNEVGPAINSGQSLFFYGAPGNGKTAVATRITRAIGSDVYIPYALETEGSIIELYDPVCHFRTEEQGAGTDPRWIRIRRPVVSVGGELKLESLDLSYSSLRRTYEAPYQLKANMGMFLIDDFGRQQISPADILNRWIVPLELRVDFLRLATGRKLEVPFDELLVFSTNLDPASLMDEAFTRRIKYKVKARDPNKEMFRIIFVRACDQFGVPFDDEGFEYLISEHYFNTGRPFRGVHPRDLLDQLVSLARYIEEPPRMTRNMLDAVVHTYFITKL
jgi:hypothetical protein